MILNPGRDVGWLGIVSTELCDPRAQLVPEFREGVDSASKEKNTGIFRGTQHPAGDFPAIALCFTRHATRVHHNAIGTLEVLDNRDSTIVKVTEKCRAIGLIRPTPHGRNG